MAYRGKTVVYGTIKNPVFMRPPGLFNPNTWFTYFVYQHTPYDITRIGEAGAATTGK